MLGYRFGSWLSDTSRWRLRSKNWKRQVKASANGLERSKDEAAKLQVQQCRVPQLELESAFLK